MTNTVELLGLLEALYKRGDGDLEYSQVSKISDTLGLVLAEYGDCSCPEAHNGAESYAFFNNSGKKDDEQAILVYYNFDKFDDNGRMTMAGAVKELHIDYEAATGENLFEKLKNGEYLSKYQAIQAVKLTGRKIPESVYKSMVNRVHSIRVVGGNIHIRFHGKHKLSQKVLELFESALLPVLELSDGNNTVIKEVQN